MAPVKRQNTKRRVLAVVVGKLVGCCDHQPKGTEDEAGWTMMTWGRQDLDSGLNTNLYRTLMVLAKQELKRLASLYGVYDHRIHIFLYIYIALDLDICFPHPYVIYIYIYFGSSRATRVTTTCICTCRGHGILHSVRMAPDGLCQDHLPRDGEFCERGCILGSIVSCH